MGINATVEKAKKVALERGAFLLNQFENPENPRAHYVTGREILTQAGLVDVFVAGVGTGGTLVGVGKVLKDAGLGTRIVAVEPYMAPALYNLFHGEDLPIGLGIPHRIEGIGETFVPRILVDNIDVIDDVVLVRDVDAFRSVMSITLGYGFCVGVSSGANVHVARSIANTLSPKEKVVTVLPDSGQRYLDQIL
jgi:cysteine synthase A